MDDLEHQLRRYADQVEDAVGEVGLPAARSRDTAHRPTSSRRSPLLLAAAAVVLLLIGVAALVLGRDDSTAPIATEPDVTVAPDLPAAPDDAAADQAGVVDSIVEVPDVVGLDADEARQLLLGADLGFEVVFEARDDAANRVFAQDPPGGQRVEPGTVIALRVSSGPAATVPNVIGETQESATSILERLGYSVLVTVATSPLDDGLVIAQNPPPGAALAPDQIVEISVSSGPEVVPVPDVAGLDLVAALNLLRDAGFAVDPDQVAEASADVEAGRIVRTIPEAGTLMADGSVVAIVVSIGDVTVEVPLVEDLFADTAITTLRNQGLEVVTLFETVSPGSPSVGRVLRQSPEAFNDVPVGTVVTITVGEAPPETTTTTTTTTP